MSTMIECQGLSRRYPDSDGEGRGVFAIDLQIPAGSMTVLAGPSGSGKSTLLNLIGGLERADSGCLLVEGQDLNALDERGLALYRRRRVGFVFQEYNLIPSLNARENIELPLRLLGQRDDQRVEAMLERVGLGGRGAAMPNQLSGGERQRLALARAVIHRPALLLADEPTAGLDAANALMLLQLLRELNGELGVSVLLATHDARLIERIERRMRLEDGRLARG